MVISRQHRQREREREGGGWTKLEYMQEASSIGVSTIHCSGRQGPYFLPSRWSSIEIPALSVEVWVQSHTESSRCAKRFWSLPCQTPGNMGLKLELAHADIKRRIQALEMRCFYKLLSILYRVHITNEEVKARIGNAIRPYEDILTSVKRCKLKWYRHVTWSSGLAKTILHGTVQGGRRRRQIEEMMGRQHQRVDWPWMEYHTTENWEPWVVEEAGCKIYSGAPTVSQTTE